MAFKKLKSLKSVSKSTTVFNGHMLPESEHIELVKRAFSDFNFSLGKVVDSYLAVKENIIYHTDNVRLNELRTSLICKFSALKAEWGISIKNPVDLYLRILELAENDR